MEGTYQVLLRVEASDDREGDSNLSDAGAGVGVVHSGAVAGFPLPVLRYVVAGDGAASYSASAVLNRRLIEARPTGLNKHEMRQQNTGGELNREPQIDTPTGFSAERRPRRANTQTLPCTTANAMGAVACPFSAQQVMQKVHRLTDN